MFLILSFKPFGFLSSLPTAHTFFGVFCWGVRLFYGEEKLKEFLNSYKESPALLFSSPIYKRDNKLFFPKPAYLKIKEESPQAYSLQAYRNRKKLKTIKFVSEDVLRKFLEGKELEFSELLNEGDIYETALIPHASINRITNTTTGGELFFESIYGTSEFIVLIKINRWIFNEEPKKLFSAIYNLLPLGGNKSTGRGLFEVSIQEPPQWLLEYANRDGEYFYSLSDFLYDDSFDLDGSYYEVEAKRFAVENYFEKSDLLWKGPMLIIKAGAIMKTKGKKESYGMLKEFHNKYYHYGYAFPIYMRGKPK